MNERELFFCSTQLERTMAKMKTTRKNKMNEVKGNKSTVTICTAKVLYVQVKQRNGETE